jgi:predicted helicase
MDHETNWTADYKKDLNERNIQPLSDDYIKFIRFGQHFIDKNGSGVLAYISNNSFIDGIIHRQMRKHLLESFDKIYILDLHGNAKKKEVCPDGSPDQNVFDIMQGVSINLFVKTGKKKKSELGEVRHFDVYGKREEKYKFLTENTLKSFEWNLLKFDSPNFFLVKKDFSEESKYSKGFAVIELLPFKTSGVKTHDDLNMVSDNILQLKDNIIALSQQFESSKIYHYAYRPFDTGFIYYDTKLLGRSREKTIYHLKRVNIGLILVAQPQAANLNYFDCIFVSKNLTDTNMFRRGGPVTFPLYLYPEPSTQQTLDQQSHRTPNLNAVIVQQIAKGLSLEFTPEKESSNGTFAPVDILDYIYAVLHSPAYRKKYKEFLKIDFPRVPYPKDQNKFWQLVTLGGELRQIHLLESPVVERYITQYPEDGSNIVEKPVYKDGNVYINEVQYFANVPLIAWEFYIGGYQPAQKWLKDRKGRELSFEDILHYQKIIVALSETGRIMKEVDKVGVEEN